MSAPGSWPGACEAGRKSGSRQSSPRAHVATVHPKLEKPRAAQAKQPLGPPGPRNPGGEVTARRPTREEALAAQGTRARGTAPPPAGVEEAREAAAAAARQLPATYKSYTYLHNEVAMQLMKRTENLGRAYWYFRQASQVHQQAFGKPADIALYNAACCLALAAQAQIVASGRDGGGAAAPHDVSPGLPGTADDATCGPFQLAEARADLALGLLREAVDSGYSRMGHLQTDSDLQAVRILRPVEFRAVLLRIQARGTLALPVGAMRCAGSSPRPEPAAL